MKSGTKTVRKKPPGSNPIAKNMWKQNKPKVVPDKHKQLKLKEIIKSHEESNT